MKILTSLRKETSSFIRTTLAQRAVLTIGSGLLSILDPHRDDMISTFGELTSYSVLPDLHRKMLNDPEGALILRDKPVINSTVLDLNKLANYPEKSLGKEYVEYLIENNISPDTRKPVRFIEGEEQAYVMQRYREIHDFTHCILGLRTNMLGEVTVKIFEAIQLDLPMCWLAGIFGMLRLGPKHTEIYLDQNLPWIIQNAKQSKPLINVYFEKYLEKNIDELRSELNLTILPTKPSEKEFKENIN